MTDLSSSAASATPTADEAANASGKQSVWRPLRIWPLGVLLVGLWGLCLGTALQSEMTFAVMMTRFMGPLIVAGLIVIWWILFSRARWMERLIGVVGLAIIIPVAVMLSDKTIRVFGILIYALPWGISAFGVALFALRNAAGFHRTGVALLAAAIGFGYWDLVRTDEIRGDFAVSQSWRWQPTPEEKFLQNLESTTEQSVPSPVTLDSDPFENPRWPEFRGPGRDGKQPDVVLAENWSQSPPRERWRIKVGPGWSSFCVAGNHLFTQEQRGDEEVVVCYDAQSGAQVWTHKDKSRFWEVVGGPGPRATPTLAGGRLYTMGAEGVVNCLDPATGQEVWQQDVKADANRDPPPWGFASSPLVTHGVVVVHAGGKGDKGLLAYDQSTGELRWGAPSGDHTYSSPHLAEIGGESCILMVSNKGLEIVDPDDGELLAKYDFEFQGYRVVQPLVLENDNVVLGTAMGEGTRNVSVTANDQRWKTEMVWQSRLSPYFNDYVALDGYLYGFDNNIFACFDLSNGRRAWKRGRYGNGQVLALPADDQLLVLSEDGEIVLLRATPKEHMELARFRVLTGRTWNHPVLVGDELYVRNGEEAACFVMPVVERTHQENSRMGP